MRTRRHTRVLVAVLATLSLLAAACGSRLDSDTIAQAATGSATQQGNGQGLPGQGGVPGDAMPGVPGGDAPAGTNSEGNGGADETAQGTDRAGGTGQEQAGGTGGTSKGGDNRGGGTASGEPIVIGTVGWFSGPVGVAFAPMPRAVQAWAAQINANGGLDGRPVKVIVRDSQGDGAQERSHTRELIEEHGAVALVASAIVTGNIPGWADQLEKLKVPAIGGHCAKGWNDSAMLFNQCPSLDSWIYGMVELGAKYGKGKKLGGLFCEVGGMCDDIPNRLYDKGYAKRAGLDPVYRARISLTQPDFTSECIQARNAGVELMIVVGDPNTAERAASSCKRQNFTPQFLQPAALVGGDAPTQPGLENVLTPMPTFPFAGLSTPAFKEFQAAWQQYGGGRPPSGAASHGWAAAKIFEHAARAALKKDGEITSKNLLEQLYGMKNQRFGGLTVPLTFNESSGTTGADCIFYMQAKGGKWTAPIGGDPHCW